MPASSDTLVRYVTSRHQYRPSDLTVKPEAFTPNPHTELSVTKKAALTDDQLWAIGRGVVQASEPPKNLHGRSEFKLSEVRDFTLPFRDDPTEENPWHAVIYNWPQDKPTQKIHALKIAEVASKLIRPAPGNAAIQAAPED